MSGLNIATAFYSTADSWKKYNAARDAETKLERMQTPTYQRNQSILDYYQKALDKYNTNPTDTAEYKMQKQNIGQGTTQAIAASKERRLGGANIPGVINNANNALLKASVAGERQKAQQFGILGHATQMKAGEDQKAFQYNSISPYDKNYNLLAMKAAANAQAGNTAVQNAYNNILAGTVANDNGTNNNNDWLKKIMSSLYGGGKSGNKNSLITASNKTRSGLNYIPQDEQLPS